VLLATATAEGGGPAAALPWDGGTVLGRLLDQLDDLGVGSAHVIARAGGAPVLEPLLAASGLQARLQVSERDAADLRAVAAIARDGAGPMVIAYADLVTQREALAGLLFKPGLASGILSTAGAIARPFGFRTQQLRGRVVGAASAYHRVARPNATFLGVLKVGAGDRARLAEVADQLAGLLEAGIPAAWADELADKGRRWRRSLALGAINRAGDTPPAEDELDLDALPDADAQELARRTAFAPDDVASLLLVGLVRDGVHVGVAGLRKLFWARPGSTEAVARAEERIAEHDEERALLDSAVKQSDGFFTTFFVSPYSKYIARWAARRGFTPNQVTLVSAAVGLLAALAFATGHRPGLIAGAVLLQVAFTLDCVDGQLARYTRTFTKFGAWLDSIFDRGKEYLVYAGLAIGASRTGDPVWLLAGSTLTLQTVRHAIDFSYPAFQHQLIGTREQPPIEHPLDRLRQAPLPEEAAEEAVPPPAPEPAGPRARLASLWRAGDGSSGIVWLKKVIAFPIGERFAAISITAALFSPRVTFIVLLAWGGFALAYVSVGRTLRAWRRMSGSALPLGAGDNVLEAYRDDGPVAAAIGGVAARVLRVPPVVPLLAALVPLVLAIVVQGGREKDGLVFAALAWAVLAGSAASGLPLTDRLRWAVPPVIRAIEYAGLLWIAAVAGGDAPAVAFALLCAIAYHHYDAVYGSRHRGRRPSRAIQYLGGGWDGRLLVGCMLLFAVAVTPGFAVLAVWVACLYVGWSIYEWRHVARAVQPVYDDEEDEAD
jgi:hypothetical protein